MRRSPQHEVEDRLRVIVGLRLGRGTRVLAIIGKLVGEASGGNGVSIDHGGTTTSNQSPNTAFRVENGKFQGSTSLGI